MPHPGPPELVVTNLNRNFTGVSATIDQLLRHQERDHKVLFCGNPLPAVRAKPVSVREALSRSRRSPSNRPFVIWHVRRNCEMFWSLVARDILKLPIKTVFTSAAIRRHSAFPRFLISKMDAVIATSPKAATFIDRNLAATVPHGVDTERFYPIDNREQAWQATGFPGSSGIATVGRVRPEKGTDLFVEAMLRTLPERPDLTALIIGKTDFKHAQFKAKLEQKIAQAGLSKRILFTGEMQKEKLPFILSAISLLVALPRYEGYGMTPLEAMASGTPVVVSDTGAFANFVEDGKGGTLVPLEDHQQATQAIQAILESTDRVESMGQAARSVVMKQFSLTRELAGIEQVYQQLWQQKSYGKLAA